MPTTVWIIAVCVGIVAAGFAGFHIGYGKGNADGYDSGREDGKTGRYGP